MSKYDSLKFEFCPEETYWGDWCAKPQGYFRGETNMPGAKYHVGYQVFTKSVDMEVPHFHHHADEYLVFLGASFPDVFDFDAEISVMLGHDPDHMEKVVLTKPTVLRIPPNIWHCPIHFEIRKPLMFQAVYLDGTWSKILRRDLGNGQYEYIYEGDNVRMCTLVPENRCTICGKCFGGLSNITNKPE